MNTTPPVQPFVVTPATLYAGVGLTSSDDAVRPVAQMESGRVLDLRWVVLAAGRTDRRGLRGEQNEQSGWIEVHRFGRYLGIYW